MYQAVSFVCLLFQFMCEENRQKVLCNKTMEIESGQMCGEREREGGGEEEVEREGE